MQQPRLESLTVGSDDCIIQPLQAEVQPQWTVMEYNEKFNEVQNRLDNTEATLNDLEVMVNHNTTAIKQITNSFIQSVKKVEANGSPNVSGDESDNEMTQLTNEEICHACPNCVFLREKYTRLAHDFGVLIRENERMKSEFTKDFEKISELIIQQNDRIEQLGWEMKYMEFRPS